jgi:hypothetical protein
MLRRVTLPILAALAAACASRRPPEDFAPDSGLVARIREIRISAPETACPGTGFPASYTAVLDDGTTVPFATRYDRRRPPRLHVVFLERWGDAVSPLGDGGWYPDPDPLVSAHDGFTLSASLRAKPDVRATATVAPSYACTPHAFAFEGPPGGRGDGPAGDGPDLTVRLALGHSRFYPRLLVAAIEITGAPPRYYLYDATTVAPTDWLIVESRGGRGATGSRGNEGAAGRQGPPCAAGERGGNGRRGGPGGEGGRGGRITIIAPVEEPFMAGLVDGRTPGGPGGNPGRGGPGGQGGAGGSSETREGRTCGSGPRGPAGQPGPDGTAGRAGPDGPRPTVLTVPARDVFGPNAPAALLALLQ